MPNWIPIVSDVDRKRVNGWVAKAPPGTLIAFKKHDERSIEQNARMWAMLTDISEQVDWHGEKLTPLEFKDLLTAGLKQSRVINGIDGGFVVLGQHTSSMTKSEMAELIELISAFGAQHNVKFSELGDTYYA